MLKPNSSIHTNRNCLQELSTNTLQHRKTNRQLRKKIDLGTFSSHPKSNKSIGSLLVGVVKKSSVVGIKIEIHSLPNELLYSVFTFFSLKEILYKIQIVNKEWYRLIQHPYLWRMINTFSPIEFEYKYSKEKKLVERRSKGKLYIGRNRLTNETAIIRKIMLDVTNSEKDDGVPTSVLREISYLSTLNNPKIGTVSEAKVKGSLLLLAYPYHRVSLKEYMKQFSKSNESSKPANCTYNMPLDTIKVITYYIYRKWFMN
jgi:hypothetical protein